MTRLTINWCILLAVLVIAYWPALRGGMVWDDDSHLTRPSMQSWAGLWAIWSEPRATQQYYPLTHSAFWIMHKLWGDDTLGYHLVNLALHALNSFLVFAVLRRLRLRGALLASALFLLHPAQIESVAWMTELKNTLSGALALSATLSYLRSCQDFQASASEAVRWRWWAAALVFFVLGLLSKTVIATWPAAMLVIAWWKRGRIEWRRDVLPLVPFFAAAMVMGSLTAHWEQSIWRAEGEHFSLTLFQRLAVAGHAVWFYLATLFWPSNLMFFYPRWPVEEWGWRSLAAPAMVACALAILWHARKTLGRGPLAAALIFGGMLLPALGFFNLYWHFYTFVCDHMLYLPCISIFALLAVAMSRLADVAGVSTQSWVSTAFCAVVIAPLAFLTHQHAVDFVDSETLWNATIARNPTCWMAYNNLGIEQRRAGRIEESIESFKASLRIRPNHTGALTNLGISYLHAGDLKQATESLNLALVIKPDIAEAEFGLGEVLSRQGLWDQAMTRYRNSLRLQPGLAAAHAHLGLALSQVGNPIQAIAEYQAALDINPDDIDALNNLAWLLATSPDSTIIDGPRAVALAQRSVNLSGGEVPELLGTLAAACARNGDCPRAVVIAEKAVRIARAKGKTEFAEGTNGRIQLYKSGKPFTQTSQAIQPNHDTP